MTESAKQTEPQVVNVYLEEPRFSWIKFWRALGFRLAHVVRWDHPWDEAKGFAPGWMVIDLYIDLDWRDRLRALISGKMMVQCAHKTDKPVSTCFTLSDVKVLPPNYKMPKQGK